MLREHDLDTCALVRLGRDVQRACRDEDVTFLVNHDVDAACELGADGVHLGYRSVGVEAARARLSPGVLVGRSTHDALEWDAAWRAGADYVTYGPILDTPSKRGLLEPRGLRGLERAVAAAAGRPVVALGGLTPPDAPGVRAAGATGLAAIRALLDTDDETAAAAAFRSAWDAATATGSGAPGGRP